MQPTPRPFFPLARQAVLDVSTLHPENPSVRCAWGCVTLLANGTLIVETALGTRRYDMPVDGILTVRATDFPAQA